MFADNIGRVMYIFPKVDVDYQETLATLVTTKETIPSRDLGINIFRLWVEQYDHKGLQELTSHVVDILRSDPKSPCDVLWVEDHFFGSKEICVENNEGTQYSLIVYPKSVSEGLLHHDMIYFIGEEEGILFWKCDKESIDEILNNFIRPALKDGNAFRALLAAMQA